MINLSKYFKSPDVEELHINPLNIDLLTITKFVSGEENEKPVYDNNFRRVKMILAGTPLEIVVPVKELDSFLTDFNLARASDSFIDETYKIYDTELKGK